MKDFRPEVKLEHIQSVIERLGEFIGKKIKKHGNRAFWSRHHALGIQTEEYHELVEAVRNDLSDDFEKEMMDNAVVSIWWLASVEAWKEDPKEF